MANQFETSFVPQQPLLKVEAGVQRPSAPLNLSLIVSLIIFFVTLSLAGGAYFYQKQVSKEVDAKGQELTAKEKTFDISKIGTYKDLQTLLATAKGLVDTHTISSQIFNFLELRTAENIGLTALAFGQDGNLSILSLSGQAPSYEAVYYQVQKWRESKPVIQDVQVIALTLDEASGIVSFSVKITLDGSTFQYAKVLKDGANPIVKKETPATTSPQQFTGDEPTSTSSKAIVPLKPKSGNTSKP